MKRPYELTTVIRTLSSDEELQQAIDQVIAWVEEDDHGKVNKIDRNTFGRRKLAYEIDGQREGHYVLMLVDIDASHLPELELNLKLSSNVLRYLLIRADE
jgi:small subunit ribosomal protein S6